MKKLFTLLGLAFFLMFEKGVTHGAKADGQKATRPVHYKQAQIARQEEPSLIFHYYRDDERYADFEFWLWDEGDGKAYSATLDDEYGKYFIVEQALFPSGNGVSWLIRSAGGWSFQTLDMRINYSDFVFDDAVNAYHFYFVNALMRVYPSAEAASANQVLESKFVGSEKITTITNNEPNTIVFKKDAEVLINGAVSAAYNNTDFWWSFTNALPANFSVDFSATYTIEVAFKAGPIATYVLDFAGLYDDEAFINEQTYDGEDLGVTYSPTATIFKAWAPTVSKLVLRLYDKGTPLSVDALLGDDTFVAHNFVYTTKGVWSVTVAGDLHNKYYTFVATHPTGDVELVDPYAKAAGVNGLRGLIVDFSKTNPHGWENVTFSSKKPTEIIPYELHVADLTSDSTWGGSAEKAKKFSGLIESGTTYTKNGVTIKTGFDHIKELGVNALQLIPIYDQQNNELDPEFNWGYNPQNYNVLEGSYASDAHDGLVRIREFKEVVKAYAQEDIRIIMDVVYNHVANLSAHSFTKLVPGYYFRYRENGSPDNSSGVGNVTASERVMMANFMRDSTAFWTEEYKLGGFRFDLMGLHTTAAMNKVATKLRTIRADIIIFGEPWNMNQLKIKDPMAIQANLDKIPHVGAFNDQIRNAFVSNDSTPPAGWLQLDSKAIASSSQTQRRLRDGLLGKITDSTSEPSQTINYAAAHDNYTLYDKLTLAGSRPNNHFSTKTIAKQSLQADSIVLLSQGVAFIHGGSDILRSKPTGKGVLSFDYNSYKSSYEINALKWDEKVDNFDVFADYQKLIALKKNTPALHYTTNAEVAAHASVTFGNEFSKSTLEHNFIQYVAADSEYTYVVYFYGMGMRQTLNGLNGFSVVFDSSGTLADESVINEPVTLTNNTTLVLRMKTSAYDAAFMKKLAPMPSNLTWLYISLPSVIVLSGGAAFFFVLQRKKKMKGGKK